MSVEKQQVAADIKQLVAELAVKITEAQQAGLTVKLTSSDGYYVGNKAHFQVEVLEQITY